eukprot:Filipodium_phascolosomae@DN2323_c0_g1_i8.p1
MMKQAKIIESERQSVSDLLEKVNRNEVDSHLEHDKLREEANYASKKARIFKERLENIESQWNRLASTFESTVIEIRSHAEKQANDCETGAKSFMTQHQSATKLLVKSLMKKVHQSIASGTVRTWSSSSDFADNKCLCVQKGIAKLYASFMAPEADSVLKNGEWVVLIDGKQQLFIFQPPDGTHRIPKPSTLAATPKLSETEMPPPSIHVYTPETNPSSYATSMQSAVNLEPVMVQCLKKVDFIKWKSSLNAAGFTIFRVLEWPAPK